MTGDDIARLGYLVLLGVAIAGWVLAQNRRNLGRVLQQALIWSFIFLGVIGAFGLWSDIRDDVAPRQLVLDDGARIEVPRAFDGHYYLTLRVEGQPIEFVVDTGASDIVLTLEDARRLGIDPGSLRFTGVAGTANGTVRTARVILDEVALGNVRDRRVPAVVNGGAMDQSLLGMRYLQRFGRIEIADGRLLLER